MPSPPPTEVLAAFGLSGVPTRLTGGGGTSWVVDAAVLKPDADATFVEWTARLSVGIDQVGFVLPAVIPALDGRWVVGGWAATTRVAGTGAEDGPVDWRGVVEGGRALHRALRGVPRPVWLDDRADPWARADAAAWGESVPVVPPAFHVLVERLRPIAASDARDAGPDQLVHGDLTGNVLLRDGDAPAIIDLSPSWRPTAYAEGIVVADAVCWHGARPDLADQLGVPLPAVARGLLFRVLTAAELTTSATPDVLAEQVRRHTAAADVLGL